jgi:mRNA-degrading endonuclease toxin of MazEF toxin-antitoxin module
MYVKPLGTHVKPPHYINFTPNSIRKQTTNHKPALVTTNYTYNNTTKPALVTTNYTYNTTKPALVTTNYTYNNTTKPALVTNYTYNNRTKPALVTTNYTYNNTTKTQRTYFIGLSDPTILNLSFLTYR